MASKVASTALPANQAPKLNYLNNGHSLKSWLLTTDHKRIAMLYLLSVTTFFFIGGFFAMLIRLELLTPQGDLMQADTYNKVFTMHGMTMVFFFLIPVVPAVLGNFLVPLMIGAKDLAFPRINLLSWYLYVIAGALFLHCMLIGGVDTGWTFYTPYSTVGSNTNVIEAGLAVFIAGFSSIFTGLNFIVTIHRMRAPGLTWDRLPLFIWANYATSLIMILGTPVVAITIVLVAVERLFHLGIFDPALGGDPLLFQHLFWFYSHPAVYIMILPSMGVVSELITCFSRKRIFGYKFIALSSIAIAVIGFLVWAHHMFVAGISLYAAMIFSFLTFFVGVPSAVKVFNWTATLYKSSITYATPMLYAFGFIGLFHHRRIDRAVPGHARHRRARHRHLLCSRPLPLRHGRRRAHGISRRHAFLVAEDQRPHVSGRLGQTFGAARVRRFQPDVLPAIHSRLRRHAAPLLAVSAGVPGAECALDRGRQRAGRGLPVAHDLFPVVAEIRTHRQRQSVERRRPGMEDDVSAAHL